MTKSYIRVSAKELHDAFSAPFIAYFCERTCTQLIRSLNNGSPEGDRLSSWRQQVTTPLRRLLVGIAGRFLPIEKTNPTTKVRSMSVVGEQQHPPRLSQVYTIRLEDLEESKSILVFKVIEFIVTECLEALRLKMFYVKPMPILRPLLVVDGPHTTKDADICIDSMKSHVTRYHRIYKPNYQAVPNYPITIHDIRLSQAELERAINLLNRNNTPVLSFRGNPRYPVDDLKIMNLVLKIELH